MKVPRGGVDANMKISIPSANFTRQIEADDGAREVKLYKKGDLFNDEIGYYQDGKIVTIELEGYFTFYSLKPEKFNVSFLYTFGKFTNQTPLLD